MLSYLRDLFQILPGILAAIFIGATVTLFVVFPRVVNELANLLGQMGDPLELLPALIHSGVALLIDFLLGYFFVVRPLQRFRRSRGARGLIVRKGQGVAFMDTESVRQQIYAAISKIDAVKRTEVSVTNDLGRAEIQLNILADNQINAAKKKQEIRRETKKIVEDQLGIALAGEPVINMRLEPIAGEVPYAVPPEAPYTPPASQTKPAVQTEVPKPEPKPLLSRLHMGARNPEAEPVPAEEPEGEEPPIPELVKGMTDIHAGGPSSQPLFTRRPLSLGRESEERQPEQVLASQPEETPVADVPLETPTEPPDESTDKNSTTDQSTETFNNQAG
jgi:hypothetical protein